MKFSCNVVLVICLLAVLLSETDAVRRKRKRKNQKPKKTPSSSPQAGSCNLECGEGARLNSNACRCVCTKGYMYDAYWERCSDIDECDTGVHGCQNADCVNSEGSYECTCRSGYTLHADGLTCKKKPAVTICQGIACYDGAHLRERNCECICPDGLWYDFIDEKCYDINECMSGEHECQHCLNTRGSHMCYCLEGQEFNPGNKTCRNSTTTAEKVCGDKDCGGNAILNEIYCECLCGEGLYYSEMEMSCADIDECMDNTCGGHCTNLYGSYKCRCMEGMVLSEDEHLCNLPTTPNPDIFQCNRYEFMCHNNVTCVPESVICDGYNDCEDSSDESDCKPLCPPDMFLCANDFGCVYRIEVCDGEDDCGDNSDEIECECKDDSPRCIPWSARGECESNSGWMNWNCRASCGICLEEDGTESGHLTVTENAELYFLRNSAEYAALTPYVLRHTHLRPDLTRNRWQCNFITEVPSKVRQQFRLSYYYQRYAHAYEIPILASSRVSDEALKRACYVTLVLLADSREIRQNLYARFTRIIVMAEVEKTTRIPEHSTLPEDYDKYARGLGGTIHVPVITVGEENLLCLDSDTVKNEDVLVHNLAHAIHKIALGSATSDFSRRLNRAYIQARREGLWAKSRADDNKEEYFAEGTQIYFNVQGPAHREINTYVDNRDKLRFYDPRLYQIIQEIFPCKNTFVDRCSNEALPTTHIRMNCRIQRENSEIGSSVSVCADKHDSCEKWSRRGECRGNIDWMRVNCPLSCGTCNEIPLVVPDTNPDCQDKNEFCPAWASRGECEGNPAWMIPNCPRSCRSCDDSDPSCIDSNTNCRIWAQEKSCENNPGYMEVFCRLSCGIC